MLSLHPITKTPVSARSRRRVLRGEDLTIDTVNAVARRREQLAVTQEPAILERMLAAEALVHEAVEKGKGIYGVTTGFGGMADVPIQGDLAASSQDNLLAFLTAGAGRPIAPSHVRAAMLLRANMLLRGVSGARVEIVERLVTFLNADAIPVVGELGSIGASGDLIPLTTIARAITGHPMSCRVMLGGREMDSRAALAELNLEPLPLIPKEGLAIVNGTTFSSAIAANCVQAARGYLALAFASHAMMIRALCGSEEPFDSFVHENKPHPGQILAARVMRQLLTVSPEGNGATQSQRRPHVQDRYSLRCLPQYLGPIVEGLARVTQVIETEMNSVSDNPLIEVESGRFFQSGNFLGQYVGLAMDDLRRFLGLVAKHLDVQIAQLVAPEFNHGLPPSLRGNTELCFNMGLKGLQICGNSIMPMLVYFGNPLVDHFPTHAEQFNQNINGLSWGAANLAAQSVEWFSYYAATSLIFAVQAIDLRAFTAHGHYDGRQLLSPRVIPLYEAVYQTLERQPGSLRPLVFNDADQSMEKSLALLSADIRDEGPVIASVDPIIKSLAELGSAP